MSDKKGFRRVLIVGRVVDGDGRLSEAVRLSLGEWYRVDFLEELGAAVFGADNKKVDCVVLSLIAPWTTCERQVSRPSFECFSSIPDNGLRAAIAVRFINPSLPIVLIVPTKEIAAELKEYCDGNSIQLFARPFDPESLAMMIRTAVERREKFSLCLSFDSICVSISEAKKGRRTAVKIPPGQYQLRRIPCPFENDDEGDAHLEVISKGVSLPESIWAFFDKIRFDLLTYAGLRPVVIKPLE